MSTLRGQSFHPRDSDDSYLPIFVFNGYCILKHLLWWYSILTFWEIHQMNSSSLLWHQIQRFCVFMIQRFLLITFLGKLFTMILYSLRFPFDMTTIFEIFRCRIFQPKTSLGSSLFCFLIYFLVITYFKSFNTKVHQKYFKRKNISASKWDWLAIARWMYKATH